MSLLRSVEHRASRTTRRLGIASPEARTLVAFLLLVFAAGATGGPLRTLLPVYVESELRRPASLSSALLSILLVGAGIAAVVGGALADRFGQKQTLVLGMAALPLAASLYLIPDPTLLVAVALLVGASDGLQSTGSQAYLVAGTPRAALGTVSALFFLGRTVGTSLGSLAAGTLVDHWGFGMLGVVALALSATLLVGTSRLLPEVSGLALLASTSFAHVARDYTRIAVRREFLLVAGLRFLPTCYWGVATLLIPLLLFRLSGSVFAVSVFSAVSLGIAAICQLATGRLSDRHGRGRPVVVLAALIPVAALAAALATQSFLALFAAGVFGTAVAWSLSTTFPPLVRELIPEGEHGHALGLLHLLWVTAMLLGTVAGGLLVDLDPTVPFAIVAALNVPTLLVGVRLGPRLADRGRP